MHYIKIFVASSVAAFGFLFSLLQAHDYFGLTILYSVKVSTMKAAFLVMLSCLLGSIATTMAAIGALPFRSTRAPEPSFEESLLATLTEAFRKKSYAEVIRIGEALSRPLFEAGSFSTRLKIGRVVEDAAARSERKDKQIAALIDSVGWSLVELGKYEDAERTIKHGLDLCQQIGNTFYEAKALRHLGVIKRRTGNFIEAEKYYGDAIDAAERIGDLEEKEILIAGMNYALASLYYYWNNIGKAYEYILKAVECFNNLGDEYRLNMSLVLEGDIQFKMGYPDKAKDIFRKVLRLADRNTEKLQIARSCLGLAEIYLADSRWKDAHEIVCMLEDIDLAEFKEEGDRLKKIQQKMPVIE